VIHVTEFRGAAGYRSSVPFTVSEVVMHQNVGGIDRVVRIVAGLALLGWAAFGTGDARLWGLIGILPLATGVFAWCPAYLPFGIRTCGPK
jgi:hypothetical protein